MGLRKKSKITSPSLKNYISPKNTQNQDTTAPLTNFNYLTLLNCDLQEAYYSD